MAKTKTNNNTNQDDLFFDIMIGILCIVPIIAGGIAWAITIPFCYFLINFKKFNFEVKKGYKPQSKYIAPLIAFACINGAIIGLTIASTVLLSVKGGWFSKTSNSAMAFSVVSIFLWLTILFELVIVSVVTIRQKKIKDEDLEVLIEAEQKTISERLEATTGVKAFLLGFLHDQLCKKLYLQLSDYVMQKTMEETNDVVLNKQSRVIIPSKALSTGTLILGGTGCGKTNTILHFIKEAVKTNKLVIFVNGKADDKLKYQLGHLAEENKYNFLHWNLEDKECNFDYNILEGKTPDEIISLLLEIENYEAIARAGKFDVLHYSTISQVIYEFYIPFIFKYYLPKSAFKSIDFQTLFSLTDFDKQAEVLNNNLDSFFLNPYYLDLMKKYLTYLKELSIFEWRKKNKILPLPEQPKPLNEIEKTKLFDNPDFIRYRQVFKELCKIWDRDDNGVETEQAKKGQGKFKEQWNQIRNTLFLLNKLNTNGHLLSKHGQSIKELIKSDKKTILFFNMDATSNPVGVGKIGRLIIMDIRQQFETMRHANKKICFVCDEFSSYATNAIADILEKGRSSGSETIIAAQTLAGIKIISEEFKDRIMGNTDTKVVHRVNNVKDAEELAGIFGTFEDIEKTYQTDEAELGTKGSVRMVDKYIVHPNDIKKCPAYFAYVLTLRKQKTGTKGEVKTRPMIYNGAIKIDYCGLNEDPIRVDCSENAKLRVLAELQEAREAVVAKMTDAEWIIFRQTQWDKYCANNMIPNCQVNEKFLYNKNEYILNGTDGWKP